MLSMARKIFLKALKMAALSVFETDAKKKQNKTNQRLLLVQSITRLVGS